MKKGDKSTASTGRFRSSGRVPRQLEIDCSHYQDILDSLELSEAERTDVVSALWLIMMAFIDIGYGISPTQRATAMAESEVVQVVKSFCHQSAQL